MTREDLDSASLAAWWCANARRLRVDAAEFGWTPILDAATADFEAGVPLRAVMANHHLPLPVPADADRGSLIDVGGLGIDPLKSSGRFVCPRAHPCGRRAEADPETGEEPTCHYDGQPMRVEAEDPPR